MKNKTEITMENVRFDLIDLCLGFSDIREKNIKAKQSMKNKLSLLSIVEILSILRISIATAHNEICLAKLAMSKQNGKIEELSQNDFFKGVSDGKSPVGNATKE
jgi:hypothetical protein